jgi:hypothetical protein
VSACRATAKSAPRLVDLEGVGRVATRRERLQADQSVERERVTNTP